MKLLPSVVVKFVFGSKQQNYLIQLQACLLAGVIGITCSNNSYAKTVSTIPPKVQNAIVRTHLDANHLSYIVTPLAPTLPSLSALHSDWNAGNHNGNAKSHANAKSNASQTAKSHPKNEPSNAQNLTGLPDLDLQHKYNDKKQLAVLPNHKAFISAPLTDSYAYKAYFPRVPASTMKLVSTFIALDVLGKDFVWYTRAYQTGIRIGDTLHGDIIIYGSGDPKLTHHGIAQLLGRIQATGIRHIEGDIIVDSQLFKNVTHDPAAFDNEPLRSYNASPDGMLVNFSTINIDGKIQADGKVALEYQPTLADIEFPTQIYRRSAGCRRKVVDNLAPVWDKTQLRFHKAFPSGCRNRTLYIAYPNAKTFTQQVIKAKWLAFGNTLSGVVRDSSDAKMHSPKLSQRGYAGFYQAPMMPLPIATEWSNPLSKQIDDINHYSNNVMTEQLMLSIAAHTQLSTMTTAKSTNPANIKLKHANQQLSQLPWYPARHQNVAVDYPQALTLVENWWKTHLTSNPPFMTNASGLCRSCFVSVHSLNDLLGYAYTHPDFSTFLSSLGVAGVNGTIRSHKRRLPRSSAINRAWIKTGTLDNVTAMAGYVKGKSGQDYSVVAIINLPDGQTNAVRHRLVLDSLIDWVAEH